MNSPEPGRPDACSALPLWSRPSRVVALTILAAVLGLTDLFLTLRFMQTVGLCEANPIARAVAEQGWTALAAFKILTIALSATLIILCRRWRAAEVGAWFSVVTLAGVMYLWVGYARAGHSETLRETCANSWVSLR